MKHLLEVDSIILEFDSKRVLQDVFLKNETGKTAGILGRNGTGKSCLMNIIYGVLQTTNKSIRIDGKSIYGSFQNPDNIRYLPQFNFIPKSLKTKRLFKDFNLDFSQFTCFFPEFEKYFNTKVKNLSGGEIRILEIYSILASKTKFCMLDEPFSQVMPVHIDMIKKIILEEKRNKGIIITDHLYEHIIEICDDIYVILNGKTYLTKDRNDLVKLGYINEKKRLLT
ncbi:MAG: ATP-binding cassette domain-containing protein [Bacteroidales bacterium]|jgi:ABC-type lipopolysaccharide export system ATPase subunit|nr:ATP-binding cassette domain-containing protein [Bacteroidales bacterium]